MKTIRKSPPFNKIESNKDIHSDENNFPGYPTYPPKEDIYQTDEEADLNPEDLSERKNVFKFTESQEISDIETGDDLDVPGADLDEQESIGNEDEENNYFSLGGDDHANLEEDDIDKENRMD